MKIICTICADIISNDFCATPCGHMFHYTCVTQWVRPNKTCPTCREKCLLKSIIKLFLDSSDQLALDLDTATPQEVKEQLVHQTEMLAEKDKALKEAQESLEEVRVDMLSWQSQYEATHKKLKTEQANSSTLKKQLSVMRYECENAKELRKEAETIRAELSTMKGVHKVLRSSREEVEQLQKNYSHSQLGTFVTAIKGDYEVLKQKKLALQKEKDKLAQDVSYLRKQARLKEHELRDCQAKLATAESDAQHFEAENNNLRKKVEVLQKAIDSPGSRLALKRALESPMPESVVSLVIKSDDVGASPVLASSTKARTHPEDDSDEKSVESEFKRPRLDSAPGALRPLNKPFIKNISTNNVASGFNGMGGQSNFLMPSTSFKKPGVAPLKNLKFAPRLNKPKVSRPSSLQQRLNFSGK